MNKRTMKHSMKRHFLPKRGARRSRKPTFNVEALETRWLMANPRLVAILPDAGDNLQAGRVLNVAPDELVFRFDQNQTIAANSLSGIRLTRSGGDDVLGNANDVTITPGYINVGDSVNEVVMRFSDTLPDDLYQITIVGNGAGALRNSEGDAFDADHEVPGFQDLNLPFQLNLGALVRAVVPQPVTRRTDKSLDVARNQIAVYFNDDDLSPSLAQNPSFYRLYETGETVTTQDDPAPILPVSVTYDPATDTSILTYGVDLANLSSGTGTFRLRIGNSESLPLPPFRRTESVDPGDSFSSATNLGSVDGRGQVVSSTIDPQRWTVTFPGGNDDPGSRNIAYSSERHVRLAPDSTSGITTIAYNFKQEIGRDPAGNPLFNLISEEQKQRAREAFELWSQSSGLKFIETETSGITVAFGDLRVLIPNQTGGRGDGRFFASFLDPTFETGMVVLDVAEQWDDSFGDNSTATTASWFRYVMAGIGETIGLGGANGLPEPTIMATNPPPAFPNTRAPEYLYPGTHDVAHIQNIHRPDSVDVDLYRFEVTVPGTLTAETIAQRLTNSSLLDSTLRLYRENGVGQRELLAQNDDYFSDDSRIRLSVEPGIYFIGVSSTGNNNYDPQVSGSGAGGTTQGAYELRLQVEPQLNNVLADATGIAIDGDGDGTPGGDFNFWFRAVPTAQTLYVDKIAPAGGTGTAQSPFRNIADALRQADPGEVVRIIGNGGTDNNMSTVADNQSYQIGFNLLNQPLPDGAALDVPRGVTVMVDAGVVFKMRRSSINVGSVTPEVDRSKSALQILGTPTQSVFFTSFDDESVGADTNPALATTPARGDWGGIKFRNDVDRTEGRFDYERAGIFLNHVSHADMRFGGGLVVIDSVQQVVTPIDMTDARPTITYNRISNSADAAISANPDSFEETSFLDPIYQTVPFTPDYERVGPDLRGNRLTDNTANALFIRIQTPAGNRLQEMTVPGRFDDTDVVHAISENLIVRGQPGGPVGTQISGNTNEPVENRFLLTARLDASLVIDPGIVVKLDGARIETGIGANLIAEGNAGHKVIFTSLDDDRFGAGGTFDTRSNSNRATADPGDWAGIYFGHGSSGSLDHAHVEYAGGITKIEGSFTGFNAVEIHQANVRIANSLFDNNAAGLGGQAPANRFGRGPNAPGAIFVLGAQPVIVANTFRDTRGTFVSGGLRIGPAINIDVNSLNHYRVEDAGRSTGTVDIVVAGADNQGPLVRDNELDGNVTNGMVVRGGTVTTQSIWDDTDITHVVLDQVLVPDFDTFVGLRLESSPTESLVVKFQGATAGLTATGRPLDITDRIGGSLQVVGQPGNPVILTSLRDDSSGSGFNTDTNGDDFASVAQPGDWRGIVIDQYANDRNVSVYTEREVPSSTGAGSNGTPTTAESVGVLAPNEKSGDDTRRLGFEIHGVISEPKDVDVYSFTAQAGTLVWIDIDRTSTRLDSVVELVSASGTVLARSDNSAGEEFSLNAVSGQQLGNLSGIGKVLDVTHELPGDLYTMNSLDAGMRVALPGAAGSTGTYHVRIRSTSPNLDGSLDGGVSSGAYDLQIRLREVDEVPGVSVSAANISYAVNGIEVLGQPKHSPLLGEYSETSGDNETLATAQNLGNVLVQDRGVVTVAGQLSSSTDVDWYQVEVRHESVRTVSPEPSVSVVFDIDYADGLGRPDTILSVFTPDGNLVLTSNDSGISDDVPKPSSGSDTGDLGRGSVGQLDPTIGPVQLRPGTYYVAVSSGTVPIDFAQFVQQDAGSAFVRFEPLDSVSRIGEDHISNGNVSTAYEPQIPLVFGDEFAVVIPSNVSITEGETVTVESLAGHKVTFEFDSEGFRLFPPAPANLLDGETVSIRSMPSFFGNTSGNTATFKLNSQGFVLNFAQPNLISDGDSIFVQSSDGVIVTYEFDSNLLTSPGSVGVFFTPGQTAEQLALLLANAITANGRLTATANGSRVNIPRAATVGGGIGSGIVITSPVSGNEISVFYDLTGTQEQLTRDLAAAINQSGIGIATVEGTHSFSIRVDSILDVRLTRGGGMQSNTPVRGANFPVAYTPADDAATLAQSLVSAIDSAMGTFGISAFSTTDLSGRVNVSMTDTSTTTPGTVTTLNPQVPIVGLSPDSDLKIVRPAAVPFTLQDVTLYVVEGIGQTNNTRSTLSTFDAYTGLRETYVGPFGQVVGDVAFRPAGRGSLFTITNTNGNGDRNDGATGETLELSTTNGASNSIGDDGIVTYVRDPANPTGAIVTNNGNGSGINFQAMTFASNNFFYAIGSRYDAPFIEPLDPTLLQGNDYRSNLIYLIDARDGAADSVGNNRGGNNGPEYLGAGTQIRELGYIDTFNDLDNSAGRTLTTVDASLLQASGLVTRRLTDGMTIVLDDGGAPVTLELESGPEVRIGVDATSGQTIRDGQSFTVNGQRYVFDTGSVLSVNAGASGFRDGDRLVVTDTRGLTHSLEFDVDGTVPTGNTAIRYTPLSTQADMLREIVNAINGLTRSNIVASSVGNRITLVNDTDVVENSAGIALSGDYGITNGTALKIEENFSADQIGQVIQNAFKSIASVTVGHIGPYINFLGATNVDFSGTPLLFSQAAAGGIAAGSDGAIGFLVSDSAEIIAGRIAKAVNAQTTGTARQLTDNTVTLLTNGIGPVTVTFTSASTPLSLGGTPPGGRITGAALLEDENGNEKLMAVSDAGGLFEFDIQTRESRYVATSTDLLTGSSFGGPIRFAGLTTGPADIENGRYARTLFGIDTFGTMYAFNDLGQLVPVFANGASSIETDAIQPVGLTFSTLQENLWGPTGLRRGDQGHGVDVPVTDSRLREARGGNTSLHFGVHANDPNDRNYNFAGGTHGTLISNPFDLSDVSAADQPYLYFNYFLDTEAAVYAPNANPPQPMRDSFRVYVMDDRTDGDRGEWHLLATNNEYRNDNDYDEFDDMNVLDDVRVDVQELYDNVGWRQARISLAEFAGRENLRLRFEFATAGGMSLGNDSFGFNSFLGGSFQSPGLGGSEGTELRAIPASEIRDGHQVSIGSFGSFFGGFNPGITLEFDLGFTLSPPSGDRIPDGETFVMRSFVGDPVTYEFDSNGVLTPGNTPVVIRSTMSSSDVAKAIEQAIAASDLGRPTVGPGRFTANILDEANDNVRVAIDTGLTPASSGIFSGSGRIGDNLDISSTSDVDMFRVDLNAGDNIQVRLDSTGNGGFGLSTALRLFNSAGIELQGNSGGFFGNVDPFLDFTAVESGTYYIGVSSGANTIYDPIEGLLGFTGPNTGTVGTYGIEIVTGGARLTTYRDGSRLNIQGAADVFQPVTGTNPAMFVDGAPGTLNTFTVPVTIHGGMNDTEVAAAIEKALASGFSGGEADWVLRRDEMIKIGGRSILDPGPLAMSDHLWGDFSSAFNFSWSSQGYPNGPLRGLDNAREGAYVDDILIGFAERGEMITNSSADTTFIARPGLTDQTIVTGPYQLEIREASQYGQTNGARPLLIPLRSFDTNDRLTDAVTITASLGAEISSGQSFELSDGRDSVRYVYRDRTIVEGNDTLASAEPSGVTPGGRSSYFGLGVIGDNRAFGGDNSNSLLGADVDLIEMDLRQGDLVVIDVDAYNPDDLVIRPSNLDAALRIFDATGRQLNLSDNTLGPEDLNIRDFFLDPAVTFRAPSTGKFYVGVSQSGNVVYNPQIAGSGIAPTRFDSLRLPTVDNDDVLQSNDAPEVSGGTYSIAINVNGGASASSAIEIPFASFDSDVDIANRVTRAINSVPSQQRAAITAGPRENSPIIDLYGSQITFTDSVVSTVPERNDTIATAQTTNAVIGRSTRFIARGMIGDNIDLATNPGLDVDIFRVDLQTGAILTVDIDATEQGSNLLAGVTIFDSNGNPLGASVDNQAALRALENDFLIADFLTPEDRKTFGIDPYLQFRAPVTGVYYIAISSQANLTQTANPGTLRFDVTPNFDALVSGSGTLVSEFFHTGEYEAEITIGNGGVDFDREALQGDSNITREQGQILLHGNQILHSQSFGILVDAGTRDNVGNIPHPGTIRNLPTINVERLVTGVSISNNIIARSGDGGILFSGDPNNGTDQLGAVPFGRIVNNTIFGGEADPNNPLRTTVGISVTENASPTLLNNIIAEFGTGLLIDNSSSTTVVGATIYQGNDTSAQTPTQGSGDFSLLLSRFNPLFVNSTENNFYLVSNSAAIDSSLDSLADRVTLINVHNPLGIPVSPILAPNYDVAGQLRVDDPSVNTPVGQGENVFKDRGALDRADFTGPSASLAFPQDNDLEGRDRDPREGFVVTTARNLGAFEIELRDRTTGGGIGIDDTSVTSALVTIEKDGQTLVEGTDYIFEYSRTNDRIRLRPLTGVWERNSEYVITLDNALIQDLAGNPLSPNRLDGETIFEIASGLGRDYGDAPDPSYPTLSINAGASHDIVEDFYLGSGVSGETDGKPSSAANADDLDDGVTFLGGFSPGLLTDIRITASDAGFIDAWFDWNRDGVWSNDGERMLQRFSVNAGANVVTVRSSSEAPLGNTFARFRFSSAGGLTPNGPATDGEVEDYQVSLIVNPWQNPRNQFNVNDDALGAVSPLDAIIVINELNDFQYANPTTGRLPIPSGIANVPPPFLDVTGDGFVSPLDALLVINNLPSNGAAASRAPLSQSVGATVIGAPINTEPQSLRQNASADDVARIDAAFSNNDRTNEVVPIGTQRKYRAAESTRRRRDVDATNDWYDLVALAFADDNATTQE